MPHTLAENYTAFSLIKPQSISATTTGTGVTVEQYEDDAMAVVDYGALGGTSETFIATIETSTDGTNYSTALTFGTVAGNTGDNTIAAGKVSLKNVKKVRAVITMSGTSASLVSVTLLARIRIGGAAANSTTPA